MKRYIKSAVDVYDPDNRPDLPNRPAEITNNYLHTVFKRLDWDDVDYADRLINRTLKKELGVSNPFDQAEYINQLPEDIKNSLMDLLENPEAVHDKRMKVKKKKPTSSKPCKLYVKWEVYERYGSSRVEIEEKTFSAPDRRSALIKMTKDLLLYIDEDQIQEDQMTDADIINSIESNNGDGCDFIILMKDLTTNETLMDNTSDYEELMYDQDEM